MESTYGDRNHKDRAATVAELGAIFAEALAEGGNVIIPAFAVGRSQELLYQFAGHYDAWKLAQWSIFLDSPMAVSATQLYANSKEEHDEDMLIAVSEGDHQLEPEGFTIVRDRDASKALNFRPGPFVVIAGSGMANAGRVVHHLTHRLGQASTQVLFTGYQAEGTLGRRLMDGADRVKVLGTEISVKATVDKLNSLSAHADQDEILKWLGGFQRAPKTTFLVHGEPDAQHGLQARIKADLGWNVEIPAMNQSFELS
jgi:metallo-beta-lactamase family protein